MHKAEQPTPRYLHRLKLPWIRAFVLEAKNSDLMVSILKKGQSRNKKASGSLMKKAARPPLTPIDDRTLGGEFGTV